ncbi:MAG: helicase-related protein, partial [Candidatus Omnitrophota bacterium]
LIEHLKRCNGLPAIYFVFGRRKAEELAFELMRNSFLSEREQREINALYDSLVDRHDLRQERSMREMYPLITRGIAYHHAGMLPSVKEVIERLFTSRLIKVIFTTETFALGINMPSRSVIFDGLKKFYGTHTGFLKTRDFYQMAGRSGRRSIDTEGFVYCRVDLRQIPVTELRRIIFSKPEAVRSQFNTSYATLLNLYEKHAEELIKIYPYSLHNYQARRGEQREATRLIRAKLEVLHELGFIAGKKLTQKGLFAKSIYGYELILSELYEQGFLDGLGTAGLGVLCLSAVFEPRKNQRLPPLSQNSQRIKKACDAVFKRIRVAEKRARIYPPTKMVHFHLSDCLESWMRREDFTTALRHTDADEGEVVRYFRMTAQTLREIEESRIAPVALREKVKAARALINRDIVDAAKQLQAY